MKVACVFTTIWALVAVVSASETCLEDPSPDDFISCECSGGKLKRNGCGSTATPACVSTRCYCVKNEKVPILPPKPKDDEYTRCCSQSSGCFLIRSSEHWPVCDGMTSGSSEVGLGAYTQYSITFDMTSDAAGELIDQGMTVVLAKGFRAGSEVSFNTAWLTIPPNEARVGTHKFSWNPLYAFRFASTATGGNIIEESD